jgi:hypothetical protein
MRPIVMGLRAGWRRIHPLRCSFCGRNENQVDRLVAGAAGHICDTCITQCVSILQHHGGFDVPSKPHEAQS